MITLKLTPVNELFTIRGALREAELAEMGAMAKAAGGRPRKEGREGRYATMYDFADESESEAVALRLRDARFSDAAELLTLADQAEALAATWHVAQRRRDAEQLFKMFNR